MKALTIWQPWASLVIAGAKPFEFRGWRPPRSIVGQRIVIHAAKRKADFHECRQLLRLLEAGGRYAARTCLIADLAIPILSGCAAELPLSAGLGTAMIGDPRLGVEIARDFGVLAANDSNREEHSNWGWPMLEVERWAAPFPMRGAQGLWNWPDAERMAS
jgi:hypothetical protein